MIGCCCSSLILEANMQKYPFFQSPEERRFEPAPRFGEHSTYSQSLVARFNKLLQDKKLSLPQCPASSDFNWIIAPALVEVRPHVGRVMRFSITGDEITYPMVMLICKTCGYSIFYNATVLGLTQEGG